MTVSHDNSIVPTRMWANVAKRYLVNEVLATDLVSVPSPLCILSDSLFVSFTLVLVNHDQCSVLLTRERDGSLYFLEGEITSLEKGMEREVELKCKEKYGVEVSFKGIRAVQNFLVALKTCHVRFFVIASMKNTSDPLVFDGVWLPLIDVNSPLIVENPFSEFLTSSLDGCVPYTFTEDQFNCISFRVVVLHQDKFLVFETLQNVRSGENFSFCAKRIAISHGLNIENLKVIGVESNHLTFRFVIFATSTTVLEDSKETEQVDFMDHKINPAELNYKTKEEVELLVHYPIIVNELGAVLIEQQV